MASFGMLAALLVLMGSIAAWVTFTRGYALYDGDAEAHLNIARRLIDSRTPGPEQLGTVWLPLPHLLLAPFAAVDAWWFNGLAGVIPSVIYFVVAGLGLFGAVLRLAGNPIAAWVATLLFATNPNILYFATVPMTEMLFLAAFLMLLWSLLEYQDEGGWIAFLGSLVALEAAALTRYEGWVLIPFAAVAVALRSRRHALLFLALASLAPLSWLAHNQYYYSDALEFLHGDWSAEAIHRASVSKGTIYPTDHNWQASVWFYVEAARLVAGPVLLALGAAGIALLAWLRKWTALLLILPGSLFYLYSLHQGTADLYVPTFWPFSHYNLRYVLGVVPACAIGVGMIAAKLPNNLGILLLLATAAPWLRPVASICWQEAAINSAPRRALQTKVALQLRQSLQPGEDVLAPFGDLAGVLREAHIPLRRALYDGNHPGWEAALARPDLFLTQSWVLTRRGSAEEVALLRSLSSRRSIRGQQVFFVRGAPSVTLYHLE